MKVPEQLPARLPQAAEAIVKRDKVVKYLLDPGHPEGGHKARRLREKLGYVREDAERLRNDLLAGVVDGLVVRCRVARPSGLSWTVDVELTGPSGASAIVRTEWHILAPGAAPRLTTARIAT